MSLLRRLVLTVLLSATLTSPLAATVARAQVMPRVTQADHAIGDPDAPVTVVEYGSLACPHCADWQLSSWYAFKARFVDTGRVRFVYRDMLTEPTDQAAMGAAIARCSAPERYFEVIHMLFRWQSTARNYGPVSEWYDRGISLSGRDPDVVRACVRDPATLRGINDTMRAGIAAGVRHTPTFFIDGQIQQDSSLDALAAAIDAR